MNLADLGLGLREALLGIVVLLGVYILATMIRLRRLRAAQPAPPPVAEPVVHVEEPPTEPPPPEPAPAPAKAEPAARTHWYEPPEPFPGEDRIEALERQVVILREHLATVRGELAALREETRQQVAQVQATQHVSPIYGEAMQMATAGYDAAEIAERCGIARAEAELVVALARRHEPDDA